MASAAPDLASSPLAAAVSAAAGAAESSGLLSLAHLLYSNRHTLIIEARLVALTLAIIYVSAHGALQRPHSAAPREKADDGAGKKKTKKDDKSMAEGGDDPFGRVSLNVSDVIMMPVMCGVVLVGLYYLIQYLQDPALLNRIMRTYASAAAVSCLGMLLGDALRVATSVVFPNVWAGQDAAGRPVLFRIEPVRRRQVQQQRAEGAKEEAWTTDTTSRSPLPGWLASLTRTRSSVRTAWALRRLFTGTGTMRLAIRGVVDEEFGTVSLSTIVGALLSVSLAATYYFFGNTLPTVLSSELSNLMGLGFCYSGLLLVSCSSFGIGSLLLVGLFFYDIFMVFYTPFMLTVATNIKAPIMLVGQSGGRSSMLGLGDIAVPGIYICLCLRYDLYRFYARQMRKVATELQTETEIDVTSTAAAEPTTSTITVTATETQMRIVKAPYIDPQGRWGDMLWTWVIRGASAGPPTPGLRAAAFPKPCFLVAMVAYVVGLLLAMGAMMYTGRGQPALFYLVPSVLLATWGWGFWTGELKEMWAYTEDGTNDVKDVVVDIDKDGKVIEKEKEKEKKEKEEKEKKEEDEDERPDLLLFSIRASANEEFVS